MKYIVCYSGGHSSALAAIETVRLYGKENVILLNHNISPKVEHEDIKRFKDDISNYLDIPITYANHQEWETATPLDIVEKQGCISSNGHMALCTHQLKTLPFYEYLDKNYPVKSINQFDIFGDIQEDVKIIYGFDKNEPQRITRRSQSLGMMGYATEFPLLSAPKVVKTLQVGIRPPITYDIFKHANCIGCLKGGLQHWYITFCLREDIWEHAKIVEDKQDFAIIKENVFLKDQECKFIKMLKANIVPSEKGNPQTFWAEVRKELGADYNRPCECAI